MDDEGQQLQLGAMPHPPAYDRDRLEYELTVRQEPKQARMCGVGGKADRRPIDPPPIVQLRVVDKDASRSSSPDGQQSHYTQSFLQNPYYFMFASLASPDRDEELHLLKDGKTRCTTGSVVSSLYHLKDTEADGERGQGRDAGFFVFPDLSVRTEGSYRLKLTLFEVIGANVHHCKSIFSQQFYVYTAKKFPGMEESTNLSCALADQGIKIRIRKDIRNRKNRPPLSTYQPCPVQPPNLRATVPTGLPSPMAEDDESAHSEDTERAGRLKRNERSGRESKRPRIEDVSVDQGVPPPHSQWNIDPNLGPLPSPTAQPPNMPSRSTAPEHGAYDQRGYPAGPSSHPQHHQSPPHPDYHHPPPHHQHPNHPLPPPAHHQQHNAPPPPPNGAYPYAQPQWGPPAPPQGYGGYHQHQAAYDHHMPPSGHHQHQRGPPQQPHYGPPPPVGAPGQQPMHYGAPPPPYGYYDQHGYAQPPPPPPPAPGPGPMPSSPRSSAQGIHHSSQVARSAKDAYGAPAPPATGQPVPPPVSGYPQQDYNYGRPPPQQDNRSAPPPPPPHQQNRGYQQPYAPAPQQHPGHYAPHPAQHHMGYGYPPAPHDPYAWGNPGYAPVPPFPPQAQQPPPGQGQVPYGRPPVQNPQWVGPPPQAAPAMQAAQGQYGYRGSPGPQQPPVNDGYAPVPGSSSGEHRGSYAPVSGGGYVRPGVEDGRRSPPAPSISGQNRHSVNMSSAGGSNSGDRRVASGSSSGGMVGNSAVPGTSGGGGDRIQLAPLRPNANTPPPQSSGPSNYSPYHLGRSNSQYGAVGLERSASGNASKKNPLSIGSIISDETK